MTAAAFTWARSDRHARHVWLAAYVIVVGGGLVIAAVARRRVTEPFLGLSLALIVLMLTGWLLRPRATLYATLFLTAVSDIVTVSWFPFAKNLSSRESISFVADSLTISPLELTLFLGVIVSMVRRYADSQTVLPKHPLTWPVVAFTAFVVYGFAAGILRGGDPRVAALEGRALFYLAFTFIIVLNECTEQRHFRFALWSVVAGVTVQALLSIQYLSGLDGAARDDLETLNEHGSALAQNWLVIMLLILVLFAIRTPGAKWALLACSAPTVIVYFVSQRRAGIAALSVAGIYIAIALCWRRRRRFWVITPSVALVLIGYLGAFWNSQAAAGFPAQAIKTVIAPGSLSYEDQSSDMYRTVEAYDLNFTIRTDPIKGLGFGRPFYRPIPLADISWFELNAFVPHNSVLWIWLKMGFGGFVAMFYLFAKAIMLGADRVRRIGFDIDLAVALSAVCFVAMYGVYSFVDISWDARNTVFLGLACTVCGGLDQRVGVRSDV